MKFDMCHDALRFIHVYISFADDHDIRNCFIFKLAVIFRCYFLIYIDNFFCNSCVPDPVPCDVAGGRATSLLHGARVGPIRQPRPKHALPKTVSSYGWWDVFKPLWYQQFSWFCSHFCRQLWNWINWSLTLCRRYLHYFPLRITFS